MLSSELCSPKQARRSDMIGLFWYLLGYAILFPLIIVCIYQVEQNTKCRSLCGIGVTSILCCMFLTINTCAYVYGRHMPRRLSGRHVQLAIYVTTLFAAILLRRCMEYSLENLAILVLSFLEVLVVWKLCQGATDFYFGDALMITTMEVASYATFSKPYFSAVLVLCGAVILCRYWFYSSSDTCLGHTEDLEMAHCLVETPNS